MVDDEQTDGHLGNHQEDGNQTKVLPIGEEGPPAELPSEKVLDGHPKGRPAMTTPATTRCDLTVNRLSFPRNHR